MKLYTIEQIREVISLSRESYGYDGYKFDEDEILKKLTPIELPSDEEIENEGKEIWGKLMDEKAFIFGAKRMKEKILNQNK